MRAALALLFLLPAAAAGGEEPVDVWQQLQKKAPDAAFTRLDSAVQRLRDLEGKIVVLDFWTTWCQPCIDELPELVAFDRWARLRDDVVFFAVNDDLDAGALSRFLNARQLTFPVLLMGPGNPLKISGYPTKILIDRGGFVRLRFWGGPVPAEELKERTLRLVQP